MIKEEQKKNNNKNNKNNNKRTTRTTIRIKQEYNVYIIKHNKNVTQLIRITIRLHLTIRTITIRITQEYQVNNKHNIKIRRIRRITTCIILTMI